MRRAGSIRVCPKAILDIGAEFDKLIQLSTASNDCPQALHNKTVSKGIHDNLLDLR
jgi:hypothetical protein